MKSFEQMTADRIKTLSMWCSVLSAAFLAALAVAVWGQIRQTINEHSTCMIQARGLPAGHELAASMKDIHKLLTIPPSPGSPPVPPRVALIVNSLDGHLSAYLAAEAQQPQSRAC